MGRKEDRKLKKVKGEALLSDGSGFDQSKQLTPFIMGDTRVIPVHVDITRQ